MKNWERIPSWAILFEAFFLSKRSFFPRCTYYNSKLESVVWRNPPGNKIMNVTLVKLYLIIINYVWRRLSWRTMQIFILSPICTYDIPVLGTCRGWPELENFRQLSDCLLGQFFWKVPIFGQFFPRQTLWKKTLCTYFDKNWVGIHFSDPSGHHGTMLQYEGRDINLLYINEPKLNRVSVRECCKIWGFSFLWLNWPTKGTGTQGDQIGLIFAIGWFFTLGSFLVK
jgi:hypothetical protein